MKVPSKKLNPKIIAFDLDDTLLNKDLIITPKTLNSLRNAAKKGIYIVLCSGRAEEAILRFVHTIDIAGLEFGRYIISLNGASVFDMHKRQTIYSRKVEGNILLEAYKEARKNNLYAEVYNSSTIFAPVDNEWTQMDASLCKLKIEIVPEYEKLLEKGHSKMIIPGKPEVLVDLQKELKEKFGDKAEIFTSKPFFLEIMPENCGKGQALLWLAEKIGLKPEDTMAFGDSMNDESMIRLAHTSVAMSNGLDYIKDISTYVTRKSNNEDGIADFIDSFIL